MKRVKFQLAIVLLCGVAALASSCKSQGSGCYYSATETQCKQKRTSIDDFQNNYVVHPKDIEVAE